MTEQSNDADNELQLEERVKLFTQTYQEVFGSDSSVPKQKPVGIVSSRIFDSADSPDILFRVDKSLRESALINGATYVFNVTHNSSMGISTAGYSKVTIIVSGDAYKREI